MAIAASYPNDDNVMLLVGSAKSLIATANALTKIFPNINMKSFALKKANIEESNLSNFFLKKRNLKKLETEIRKLPSVDRVFYIQEWNVYTTYIVFLAEEITPSVSFNFLDDGIYTYVEIEKDGKTALERLVDRIVYGKWHINSKLPGVLRDNSPIYAMFPELLPEVYKNKKQVRINMELLLGYIDEKVLAELTSTCEEDNVEVIIATDFKSNYTSDEYKKIITSIIVNCCDMNLKTAIKRHPADYVCFDFTPECYETEELLAYIPIELYYLRFHRSLKKIIGGLSTSLLTARTMLPNVDIESVVSRKYMECDKNAVNILQLFSKVGIKITMIT